MSEIEKFVSRVQKSVRANSKEIKLSMPEAQQLSNELALLLVRENKLLEKITILQENQNQKVNRDLAEGFDLDGGSFKS